MLEMLASLDKTLLFHNTMYAMCKSLGVHRCFCVVSAGRPPPWTLNTPITLPPIGATHVGEHTFDEEASAAGQPSIAFGENVNDKCLGASVAAFWREAVEAP